MIPDQTERTLTFPENDAVRALAGEFGAHLKMVGRAYSLEVAQRGAQVRVGPGNPPDVDAACKLLQGLYALVEKNYSLRPADVPRCAPKRRARTPLRRAVGTYRFEIPTARWSQNFPGPARNLSPAARS